MALALLVNRDLAAARGLPIALALFASAPRAEAILEFPLSANKLPSHIAVGSDGALWFTQVDRIGRISTGGVITDYAVGSVFNPQGITSGTGRRALVRRLARTGSDA